MTNKSIFEVVKDVEKTIKAGKKYVAFNGDLYIVKDITYITKDGDVTFDLYHTCHYKHFQSKDDAKISALDQKKNLKLRRIKDCKKSIEHYSKLLKELEND